MSFWEDDDDYDDKFVNAWDPRELEEYRTSLYESLRDAIMQSDEAPGLALDGWFHIWYGSGKNMTECNQLYPEMVKNLEHIWDRAHVLEDYEFLSKFKLARLYAIWKERELGKHLKSELNEFLNDLNF